MKIWGADAKLWEEVRKENSYHSKEFIQPWEGKSSPGTLQDQWNSLYKNTLEKKQQMTVAPWQTANYEDPHFLEHDNNITEPIHRYVPYDSGMGRNLYFLADHPQIALQVGGWEMVRDFAGKIGIPMSRGDDTSGDAIRFATEGGKGIDRGGLALEVFQEFDKKKTRIKQPDGSKKEEWRGPGDGTEVNAARHTLWNMINTNRFGINMAKEIADLHETNPYTDTDKRIFDPDDYKESSTNPHPKRCVVTDDPAPEKCALADADEVVDLLNNRIGRNLGLGYAPETITNDLALGMLDYFYHYGLYTVKKIGGKYEVLKTKIKKEQYDNLKRVFTFELDDDGYKFGRNPKTLSRESIKYIIENYGYL